jgi:predicted dehydrogenase
VSVDATARPLTFGVTGLGYWGPNILRVLSEMEDVEVRWICDLDEDRLRRYANRYPTVDATTDFGTLLNDDEVDAVAIATPVYTHFDLAMRSLQAGKHTFVEKPLASSTNAADLLVESADSRGLQLMCGHTFLYSPAVRFVSELLERGELGDIFFVSSSRVNLGLHQRDISVVWDLGPHDFSILLHWLGEVPVSVRAVGRDSIVKDIHDVAFVTLTFASGLVASVELSWLAPSKLRRTVVVGSEKMVVYDDGSSEPIRLFDHGVVYRDPQTFGEYHLSYRTGHIISPKLDSYEPLSRQMSDFVAATRGEVSLQRQTALARGVVRIAEAADLSLREGGREVRLRKAFFHDLAPASSLTKTFSAR